MKILSQPKDNFTWKKETTCGGCKSKLEIVPTDLKIQPDSRDGDYAFCRCPVCNHLITFASSLIPKYVWNILK